MSELYFNVTCHQKPKVKVKKRPNKDELSVSQRFSEKIDKLKNVGNEKLAHKLESKRDYEYALLKAQGIKVKDTEKVVKKLIKRRAKNKEKSQAEWAGRLKKLKASKTESDKKRSDNIKKKIQRKTDSKLKKVSKKSKKINKTKNSKKNKQKKK